MDTTALLVLDVQNELVEPAGKVGSMGFAKVVEQSGLLAKTAAVIAAMRAKQQPVALVNVRFRADHGDDAGFIVKVLEDCCASPDPELHRIECEKILPLFGSVMSSQAFIDAL